LITLKKEKEQLDQQYSSFLNSIEAEEVLEEPQETSTEGEDGKLPF
jgi:hypothetical protein